MGFLLFTTDQWGIPVVIFHVHVPGLGVGFVWNDKDNGCK